MIALIKVWYRKASARVSIICEFDIVGMASGAAKEANDSLEDLFNEAARLIDDSSKEHPLPEAGKTPTTPVQGKDLAAEVDGGNGT